VGVTRGHRERAPASEFLDRQEIDGLHGKARRERVPSVVQANILDRGGGDSLWKGFPGPPAIKRAVHMEP
jgi:hypothetical protein